MLIHQLVRKCFDYSWSDLTSLSLINTAVDHDGDDIVRANLATDTSYMRVVVLSYRTKEEGTYKDWIESVFHVESLHALDCKNNVEITKTETVEWNYITSIAHEQLSVRGLQDSVSSVAQKCKNIPARTADFEDAVYERIGDIPLKLLSRPDHYVRQNVSRSLLESTGVTLETCLARCEWDFASAPASIYRQVLKLEQLIRYPSRKLILREIETDKLYGGAGCRRKPSKVTDPFDKYEVFIQCAREDADLSVPIDTMACILESYGNVGVKKLRWEVGDSLELLPAPATSMTISGFLAPLLKEFTGRLVYIEVKPATTSLANIASQHLLLVKAANSTSFVAGAKAKLIAGSATSDKLRLLGYRTFMTALAETNMVSPQTSVLYRPSTAASTGATEVARDRFVICSNSGTTVGDTLPANGIYYTVCAAVYIQLKEFNLVELYNGRLLAISRGDSGRTKIVKGSEVVPFAKEESFRAQFQVFFQCTTASHSPAQVVLIDKEKIPSVVATEAIKNVMILRYYPVPGTISRDTRTHHGVCISENQQIHVSDVGYRDDDFLIGFRRGGTGDNSYKFNIRKEDDFGHVNKRIMVKLPGVGVVFCRGIGPNSDNPEMACLLFDSTTGKVTNKYGFKGKLGHWRDIVQ
ncbi:hypothetical protein P3T76_003043 [Phytophthora citrophthora]|uniref:Uncharacterized protein n=1 Tax=Phytophthora citrophthora TaxID=4793 RepID=A0AAD9LQI8_9STRA|nr:hypothetical protein P3T76_003043 [Phytophthora citrophthora]